MIRPPLGPIIRPPLSGPVASGGVSPPLGLYVPSCVFDLDATIAASYPGTGTTWFNYEPTPADGSAKSAYDFTSSGSGNSFVGTAGTPSAYWLFNNSGYFNLSVNPSFIAGLQRTDIPGQAYAGFIAFQFVAGTATNQSFIGTSSASTVVGVRMLSSTADSLQCPQRGDTAQVSPVTGVSLTSGIHFLGWSCQSDGTNIRIWLDSSTATNVARTPNACVTDTPNTMDIAASGNGAGRVANGTRIYAASFFNSYIDDAQAAVIRSVYRFRHNRSY